MTTQEPVVLNRRRLLGSSAILAAWVAAGCDRQEVAKSTAESSSTSRSSVPLRVTLVGEPQDAETITRAWAAITEQPLGITVIPLDRSQPEGLAQAALADAGQGDVLIVPLGLVAELIDQGLVIPLSGAEFEEADQTLGPIISAVKNGAARYGGETYAVPLGASLPFLLASEELETVESWQAYDQLVERWEGAAAEPTAPGWAAAMFLWRSAAERNWLFGRDSLEPLLESESYVRSLEQMVQTCSRYQVKSQTPQQVWDGVASSKLRVGIGFPERRSTLEGIVMISDLPGTTDASRVLLDSFSPVVAMAASCRQSAVAKRFMIWLSGGEGSQSVRRQVRGMTDTRVELAGNFSPQGVSSSNYDLQLLERLSSPVTMPTLQLLGSGEYYRVLDQQVVRALNQELAPAEALAEVADRWQSITERVGIESQLRVWRRAQGFRA